MRQQVAQPARRAERDGEQPARAERRHALVEFVAGRFDRVAERLEQRAEERFAAAAGNSRESCFERQLGRREVGFPLASTAQRGVEPARKHDREQRRGDVRPVVDVLVLGAALAAAAADHSDRVDVEQDGRRARLLASPPGRRPWRCRTGTPACARAPGACAAGIRGRWPAGGSFGWSGACASGSGKSHSSIPRRHVLPRRLAEHGDACLLSIPELG